MKWKPTGIIADELAKHGLNHSHDIPDEDINAWRDEWRAHHVHKNESADDLLNRVCWFLVDEERRRREKTAKAKRDDEMNGRLANLEAKHRQFIYLLVVVLLILVAKVVHGQNTVVVRGTAKGATPSNTATVTSTSADHNAIDVNITGGGGSGGTASNFGSAFPATGTAVGFKNGGGNMDFALVDASNFLKVDCAVGCSGGSADSTASGTLSAACVDGSINSCAANSTVSMAMAGVNSASITLPSGNNFVGTIKADCSTDGGTTWFLTNIRTSALSQWVASVAVSSTNQGYEVQVCGGASHVRVRASVATSGTVTAAVRGVTQPSGLPGFAGLPGSAAPTFGAFILGSDGSVLRGIKTDASGNVSVIFPSAQAVTQSGGPWTINKTQTAGSTLGALANYGTSPGAVLVESVNAFITNTPTVTANAGTNLNTSALALESGGNLATIGGAIIAQEATTSGVKGITAFGAVTTNAPTYVTAKSDALSLDTSGLLRVSLKDTPANTNKLLVTPDSVALPANQSVNVSQINGVTPLMGNGTTGTGSHRVTISSDNSAIANWGLGATGSAVPTGGQYVGGNGSGNLTGITVCDNSSVVNMSTATTTQIIAISGTGGRTYICSLNLVTAAANNVALISGSGSNCASNVAALAGGTTAASGWNLAANGGITMGSGLGMIIKTTTTNNEVCLVTSATTQLSGSITWTQY